MKKILASSLVVVFSLLALAPVAMAAEKDVTQQHKFKKNHLNDRVRVKKDKIHTEIKELSKKYPKIRIGRAELVDIKGNDLPTEIVVKALSSKFNKVRLDDTNKLKNVEKLEIDKTYTIKVNEDTRFFRRYWGKSKLSELTVGDHLWLVVADYGNSYLGLVVKDNSIFLIGVRGLVVEVNYESNSFVIKRGDRKLTVNMTDRTKLIVPGIKNSTIKDIKVGNQVRARGVINGRLKNMDAWKVKVYRLQPAVTTDM